MSSAERKREKWMAFKAAVAESRKATVFGQPPPADRDERADRERRLHDRYLADKRDD